MHQSCDLRGHPGNFATVGTVVPNQDENPSISLSLYPFLSLRIFFSAAESLTEDPVAARRETSVFVDAALRCGAMSH